MSKYFVILVPTLVIILIRMRPLDLIFRPLNTLTHELSHATVALVLRQKVKRIVLNRDFSGSCLTMTSNKKALFFISLAGYTVPSVLGYALIYITDKNPSAWCFYIITAICVAVLIFALGNGFGRLWVMIFAAFNFALALLKDFGAYYPYVLYLYACILLIENLWSTVTLLDISLVSPKKAGDAALLAKTTHVPAVLWSLFFVCFTVFMFYKSIMLLKTLVVL